MVPILSNPFYVIQMQHYSPMRRGKLNLESEILHLLPGSATGDLDKSFPPFKSHFC